jgi:hypothetical protein
VSRDVSGNAGAAQVRGNDARWAEPAGKHGSVRRQVFNRQSVKFKTAAKLTHARYGPSEAAAKQSNTQPIKARI